MTQTERSGPVTGRPDTTSPADTVAPEYGEEWRQRLAQRVAQVQARGEAQRALRADLAVRRAAGKRIRHARRLAGRS